MGEIEEMHSKEEGEPILNGDISEVENGNEDSQSSLKKSQPSVESESMDVDEQSPEDITEVGDEDVDMVDEGSDRGDDDNTEPEEDAGAEEKDDDAVEEKEEDAESVKSKDEMSDSGSKTDDKPVEITNGSKSVDVEEEVHEIIDDDDDLIEESMKNGLGKDEPIELNDSGEGEGDGDVMIIEEPKENGSIDKRRASDELEVIELDSTPIKKKSELKVLPTRRSVRNMNKQKSYVESDRDEHSPPSHSSEESDIEEVLPQDPLAMSNERAEVRKSKHLNANSSTIVVKDTKRLVEIAAKSNSNNCGNKKEPTLVIIDTNSILSGRGPVPVNKSTSSSVSQSYPTLLPMALPAQGMYPPNMRATITPIPINSSAPPTPPPPLASKPSPASLSSSSSCINPAALAPVLPTLTDDMFVVEAPSFIVPYVYEKPPVTDFKEFLKEVADKIAKEKEDKSKKDQKETKKKTNKDDKMETEDVLETSDEILKEDDLMDPSKKMYSYFDSPLGKFFIDIGLNLVQEFVQSDLLKQQKRKREREGGQNPTTNKTIHSLLKNLEFTKENNEPFKTPMKKCEFCNFKTESVLVMAHHLETPHTKNYVYKCNFCTYEVSFCGGVAAPRGCKSACVQARSPHDILFHMEAEHAVRGRLERAPSFHQCPNCPFEDNQKGKLSRHLVACMRKFKPDKNLEPPFDWEPPAKIPRVPKARQGINVSAYQAMKSSQLQFLSKMQLLNTSNSSHALHRGRGRPSLAAPIKQTMLRPSGMVYKQTMSGGSVLVPTNYQLSGNQVYQQQNQSKNKSVHQPSISITPLPRASSSPNANITSKPGDTNSKNSFVICEICDGYIKDLEQLRNHMQWIHKVKIHPKMIYNRPPLNCQKCQFRFFTDQGLERHLLGSHGLVTSSMQDAANKSKDAGRCPVCGRCTVCTATFGMYKQFENHVYSAHSVVAKRVMDKKNSSSTSSANKSDSIMKPLKINDEITIIPQPAKTTTTGASKEGSPSSSTGSTNSRNSTPSTSKSR
ncbi:MOG interacting and ectopic P-granules protein 1 [Asbolus verrucosus]|uniref:MOG interacting and ectopic P-granules protein 1 n=1 Tax=Asbolus verrucosus TaxID=1661398 RepID=A0A482W967_ASBVE|nr:MOG interacting and ectopic P-granules protein 1 [Asbolus verrucosus]